MKFTSNRIQIQYHSHQFSALNSSAAIKIVVFICYHRSAITNAKFSAFNTCSIGKLCAIQSKKNNIFGLNDGQNHWSSSRSVSVLSVCAEPHRKSNQLKICMCHGKESTAKATEPEWKENKEQSIDFDRHIVAKCKSDFSRNATTVSNSNIYMWTKKKCCRSRMFRARARALIYPFIRSPNVCFSAFVSHINRNNATINNCLMFGLACAECSKMCASYWQRQRSQGDDDDDRTECICGVLFWTWQIAMWLKLHQRNIKIII